MTTPASKEFRVFISYASEDRNKVAPYYDKLQLHGIRPWMDSKDILPGQNWEQEIQRAFNAAHVILIFMTPLSVTKRGFVQREARDAMEKIRYALPGDISVIPLRLEPCDVPDQISRQVQYVDVPEDWGRVLRSLELAAEQRELRLQSGTMIGPFRVQQQLLQEEFPGEPGSRISVEYFRLSSTQKPKAADELSSVIHGLAIGKLQSGRSALLEQEPERLKHWPEESRYNSVDASITVTKATEAAFSYRIMNWGFNAGAAHGYEFFESHNFLLIDDSAVALSFDSLFESPMTGVNRIKEICRREIIGEYRERFGNAADEEAIARIHQSTDDWHHFQNFSLTDTGLLFDFDRILGYAAGLWLADVSYEEIADLIKPVVLDRLRHS